MGVGQAAGRDYPSLDDAALVRLARARDERAVRTLTARLNQRLFRAAYAILRDRAEAEEAVQDAYWRAFTTEAAFSEGAAVATWMTRIVINEALQRRRTAGRRARILGKEGVIVLQEARSAAADRAALDASPEAASARRQIALLIERAVAALPEPFRLVFMLRDIEGLGVEETALILSIPPNTVATRLLRARRKLRDTLQPAIGDPFADTFPFAGAQCAAFTEKLIARMGLEGEDAGRA